MHRARLGALEPLNGVVQRMVLDAGTFRFEPGQYIVLHAGTQRIPLSLASAPERLPEIELHYRSTPGNPDAAALDALLESVHIFVFDGPHGHVTQRGATAEPLNLVAGGTGVAQAASLIEHLLACSQREPVRLTWSVAGAADAYPVPVVGRARAMPWFSDRTLIDDPTGTSNAAVDWIASLADHRGRWLLSGAPGFVYACADALRLQGVPRSAIDADVFDYAPRSGWAARR